MSYFVKSPNLPEGQVVAVAVGEDYAEEIRSALMPYGVSILTCPNNPHVDTRLSSHIDLSVFHLGGNRFLLSCSLIGSSFAEELITIGADLIFSNSILQPEYPCDASLCALAAGEKLFHNLKCSDKNLLENDFFKKIHVNQGYTKCAVCLVSESAAITADSGLAKAMKGEGLDILEIKSGGINLKGFNEGFIGGASFKIAHDKLAFTGILDLLPDKRYIEDFLQKHKVTPIYLSDKPLFDIGSIITMIEY